MAEAELYPGARWHPLGAQTETRMRSHDIICLHTMVGYLASTDRYFRITNGEGFRGTESHFGVGGPWGPDLGGQLDGAVWQWQDLAFKADANLDGWDRVISIETADNAPLLPGDIAAWSAAQVDGLVALVDWLCSPTAHAKCPPAWTCHRDGIPRQLIPDTLPGRRGIGWHAQGVPGVGLVTGGEQWSNAKGKVCPGARRIAQVKAVIVPRVQTRATTTEEKETDMQVSELVPELVRAAKAGELDEMFTREAAMLGRAGIARGVDVRTARDQVQAAISAVRSAVEVQGDDEATVLAALEDAEGRLSTLIEDTHPGADPAPAGS